MKILIVEDDSFKFARVLEILNETIIGADIIHLDSVFGAVRYLSSANPDKIILDMSLPSHPPSAGEGSPVSMPAGGIEVLLEMRSLRKSAIPTAILTQYPDVEIEDEYYPIDQAPEVLGRLFGFDGIKVVHYEPATDEWITPIKTFISKK